MLRRFTPTFYSTAPLIFEFSPKNDHLFKNTSLLYQKNQGKYFVNDLARKGSGEHPHSGRNVKRKLLSSYNIAL